MEQSRYLMWAKRKLPDASNSYGDSWEEQAFAEDAAGPLGGCVWPPRSYSCSFCRREFRSAQALGGHMNVHRRDRARLKQSPAADVGAPQNHALSPCTFLYNNPNTNEGVRVSSPPLMKVNNEEKTSTFSLFSGTPFVHKGNLNNIVRSPRHPSWSSFVAEKRDRNVLDSMKNKESTIRETESRVEKEDCVTEDRLNLVVVCDQMQMNNTCSDEEVGSCKRRRIDQGDYLPRLSAIDRCNILPSSDFVEEELDLELRLGDAPKRDLMGVKINGGYREGAHGASYVCFGGIN